ncbi:MAG: ABC transporter permease [Oscillospiraceae bacterium]|nr:ABC transporter permease [Oscillospiraceae bacterium]
MQVFKAFLRVMRSKMSTAFIYIGIFLAIAVIMTNSDQGEQTKVFSGSKVNIVVYDDDDTPESRALRDFIGTRHNLKELERDTDKMKDVSYMGFNSDIQYIMTIEKGYAEKLRAGEYDGLFSHYRMHDSYEGMLIEQLLSEYLGTVRAYQAVGQPLDAALSRTEAVLNEETAVTIRNYDSDTAQSDVPPLLDDYFRYLPYILLSVLIEVLCPVLLALGKRTIRYRTNCSSVRPASYTLQIILGSALFVVGIWLLFIIAGITQFGMFSGKTWLTLLNSFLFAMISVSLAVLIASFHPGELVVNLMAQILGLGMSFMCGIFVPMEWLGSGVVAAARFLPAYWYVKANNIICGVSAYDGKMLFACLTIQLGFAAAFALLAMVVRRRKYAGTEQMA